MDFNTFKKRLLVRPLELEKKTNRKLLLEWEIDFKLQRTVRLSWNCGI